MAYQLNGNQGVRMMVPMSHGHLIIKRRNGNTFKCVARLPQEIDKMENIVTAFNPNKADLRMTLREFIQAGLASHQRHITSAVSSYFGDPSDENYWLARDLCWMGERMIRMAKAELGNNSAELNEIIFDLERTMRRADAVLSTVEEV